MWQKVGSMKSFETYMEFCSYDIGQLTHDKPTSFNGNVRARRYKVTIEVVSTFEEECEAVQEMWDFGDNWHHNTPIRKYAKKLGYELKGSFGGKLKSN